MTKKELEPDAVFQPEFREDLRHWVETDRRVALHVLDLVEAIMRDPFRGIGKPEPLPIWRPTPGHAASRRNTVLSTWFERIASTFCRAGTTTERTRNSDEAIRRVSPR